MSAPLAIGAIAALAAAGHSWGLHPVGVVSLVEAPPELSKRGSRSFFPTGMPEGMAKGIFMWEPVMAEISSVAPIEYEGYTNRAFEPTLFFLPAQDGQPDREVWIDEAGNTFVWSEERGKEYVDCRVGLTDLGPGEGPPISASELEYRLEYLPSIEFEESMKTIWDAQTSPDGPDVFADRDFNTYRYNRFRGWVPHRYDLKPVVRLNQAMVGQP